MAEVLKDHVRMHVIDPKCEPGLEQTQAAEELIDVAYLK